MSAARPRIDASDGWRWPLLAGPFVVLALAGAPACSDGGEPSPTVREAFLRLEHEITIGSEDGGADDSFYGILDLVMPPDGSLWVLDGGLFGSRPMIRRFDEDGRFLGRVGGIGDGPGEFRAPYAMAAFSDGRVVVRDHELPNRLNVYAADGSNEADWRLPVPVHTIAGTDQILLVDADDIVWMKVITGRPTDEDRRLGWARVGSGGALLDTIFAPGGADRMPPLRSSGTAPSTSPPPRVVLNPNGYFAVAQRSALSVSIIPIPSSGPVDRGLSGEARPLDDAPGGGTPRGMLPSTPLAISGPMQALAVGDDGRLWVQVEVDPRDELPPGESDPIPGYWQVFEPDGAAPFGNVRLPVACSVRRSRGDRIWCVTQDDLGVARVVRFRIVDTSAVRSDLTGKSLRLGG